MIELLREHLTSTNLIREKAKVIVACSGGADSIALADLLHRLNCNIVIAHVNFGLAIGKIPKCISIIDYFFCSV